jgi:regulator of protease activity HflC (stomatin/prohibitin superfamily)
VERMGKFFRIMEPGLNILFPIIDKVKYVQSLKEIAIDVPKQSAITSGKLSLQQPHLGRWHTSDFVAEFFMKRERIQVLYNRTDRQ